MLVIPIPINLYMRHLPDAAKASGYLGLVFVVARTADAREQYNELVEDWTSLHDVTGPLIGVLCPSTDGDTHLSSVNRGDGVGLGVEGLALIRAPSTDDRQFERRFWVSAMCDREIRHLVNNDKGGAFARPRRPAPRGRLAAAWTEMATTSARHFGIEERALPMVVVMSLWEHKAVVVRLRSGLSLYQLLRATIVNLGGQPERIAEMRDQNRALLCELRAQRATAAAYERWKRKIERVDAAIGASSHIEETLRNRCQMALRAVLTTGVPGDAPAALAELHRRGSSPPNDSPPLRHSAVYGLMVQLEEVDGYPDPGRAAEIEAERAQIAARELAICGQLRLAQAVIDAYGQTFTPQAEQTTNGRRGLAGWDVTMVDWSEPPALGSTTRRG